MKSKLIKALPYIIVLLVDFYLLPFFIIDTGSAILMLLLVIPLIAVICAVVYGVRLGFDFLLPILTAVLFTPTVFIHYNISAWVYIVAYSAAVLAGVGIGKLFSKKGE